MPDLKHSFPRHNEEFIRIQHGRNEERGTAKGRRIVRNERDEVTDWTVAVDSGFTGVVHIAARDLIKMSDWHSLRDHKRILAEQRQEDAATALARDEARKASEAKVLEADPFDGDEEEEVRFGGPLATPTPTPAPALQAAPSAEPAPVAGKVAPKPKTGAAPQV